MAELRNLTSEQMRDWWKKNRGKGIEYQPVGCDVWYKANPAWPASAFGTYEGGRWNVKYTTPTEDVIHAPKHYVVTLKSGAVVECIDVIESLDLGYHLGNAMKYVWRAGRKDATKKIEDLEKAVAFINRKIGLLRNGG